jgi:hypothetical protein
MCSVRGVGKGEEEAEAEWKRKGGDACAGSRGQRPTMIAVAQTDGLMDDATRHPNCQSKDFPSLRAAQNSLHTIEL